jgi:putative sigma-54 modulation protein
MRIDVKGRNVPVTDELREHAVRKFGVVDRQVSPMAELEVEIFHEPNPAIADSEVAHVTLHLKGVTLRACAASREMHHSINLASEELTVQVKRRKEKRTHRREARALGRAASALVNGAELGADMGPSTA